MAHSPHLYLGLQLRVVNHSAKVFTSTHKEIFDDLFRLATSHYSEVRQQSQQAINQGCYLYAYSYKVILDDIIALIKDDPSIQDHQFKVCYAYVAAYLYVRR